MCVLLRASWHLLCIRMHLASSKGNMAAARERGGHFSETALSPEVAEALVLGQAAGEMRARKFQGKRLLGP